MSLFEDIKEKISMTQVLERYGIEVKKGFAVCPFHSEKTASLKVYKDGFYCFGCGAGGDVVRFVSLMESTGNSQAALHIAQDFGLSCERQPRNVMTERLKEEAKRKRLLEEFRREYLRKAEEYRKNSRALLTAEEMERAKLLARQEYLDYWFEVTPWR